MKRTLLAAIALAVGLGLAVTVRTAATTQNDDSQSAIVHLSHFSDNLHATFMALKTAGWMHGEGIKVTLFLDMEGARLADNRHSLDVRWGPASTELIGYYRGFLRAGGRILVCSHCAEAASVTTQHLRDGCQIATDTQLSQMFIEADKILDY